MTLRQHQVIWPRGEEPAAGAGGDRTQGLRVTLTALTLGPRGTARSTKAMEVPLQALCF